MNTLKYIVLATGVAVVAAMGPASANSSLNAFCKAGSPTPKYICDQIKAAQKPVLKKKFGFKKSVAQPRRTIQTQSHRRAR